MVNSVEIYPEANTIVLDSVTFALSFKEARIEGGHQSGPVFAHGAARAVVSVADANKLVAAGVTDNR
ncbi:hypothetical protein [Trinickia mobilis]|uniref:hypothetical protein n=1 Tax=Trinickia mobilis TaxID=2816356 RepID=UPI001A8D16FA|nr:hypothetical protein [Trinickia mobilis]